MVRCLTGRGTMRTVRAVNGKRHSPIGNAGLRGAVLQNNNWQLVPDPLPEMAMEATPAGKIVRATGIQSAVNFSENGIQIPAK